MTDWLEPFRRDTERLREVSRKLKEYNEKRDRILEDRRIKRLIREVIQELDDHK
jgi:hypothetical protein